MSMATQTARPGGITAPDEGLATQIRVAVPGAEPALRPAGREHRLAP